MAGSISGRDLHKEKKMTKQIKHETMMMTASSSARMLLSHWHTISEEEKKEMVFSVCFAHKELMDFRNIINGMVDLKYPSKVAAAPYIQE